MTKPKNMLNVHTLRDIENREVVEDSLSKDIPSGHRLGNICESELKKALRGSIKTASDINNDYKDLQDIYL
ncbi:20522_t:CDS:1, partial [Funneliformis geosporum]